MKFSQGSKLCEHSIHGKQSLTCPSLVCASTLTCACGQILGHEDLKKYYNMAKITGSELVICFNIANLPNSSKKSYEAVMDWSATGNWLGRSRLSGWDGGAPVSLSKPAFHGMNYGSPSRIPCRSSVKPILLTRPSSKDHADPKLKKLKTIYFAASHGERMFTTESLVLGHETFIATKILPPETTTGADPTLMDGIANAVKTNSFSDLISALQSRNQRANLDYNTN